MQRNPTAYLARNSEQAKINEAAAAYLRTMFRIVRADDSPPKMTTVEVQ